MEETPMTHPVMANTISRSMDQAYLQGAQKMLETCREVVRLHLANIDMGMPAEVVAKGIERHLDQLRAEMIDKRK
jgi:hypothetical protein